MDTYAPGSLLAHLAQIPDPRSPPGQRFSLTALLAAARTASLTQPNDFLRHSTALRSTRSAGLFAKA